MLVWTYASDGFMFVDSGLTILSSGLPLVLFFMYSWL